MAKRAQAAPPVEIDIQIERWPIERLIPRANNPRTHSRAQVTSIAASMREWGWTNPILVGAEDDIIAGHARLLAAEKLGMKDKSVPPERIDPSLGRKLEEEFPGILNWLTEGHRLYMRDGLNRPPSVRAPLEGWLEDSDHIPRFIAQCCVVGQHFSAELRPIFTAYRRWCEESLVRPVSPAMFSRGMGHHGYQKDRTAKVRFYAGIKLARVTTDDRVS